MNLLWMLPAIVCYLGATACFTLARTRDTDRWNYWGALALGCGAVLHAVVLAINWMRAGNIQVTDLAESISFLGWLTAIAALVVIVLWHLAVVGAFIAPLVFVTSAIAALTMRDQSFRMPAALRSAWLPIHVTLAFAGFALFVLAAGVSVAYLVYERRLKSKRLSAHPNDRTPSLEKLDRINYRLLVFGFVMLSLAIVSGALWADATWGHFWSWEPQESWSLVVWLMYAALLESRLTAGWRGRRVATLTLVVFTVLIGSFVGVSLVTPGKHGGSFG